MAEIKQMEEKGTNILPVTSTKAIFDEDGNRLDNTLDQLNQNLTQLKPKLLWATSETSVTFAQAQQTITFDDEYDELIIVANVISNYNQNALIRREERAKTDGKIHITQTAYYTGSKAFQARARTYIPNRGSLEIRTASYNDSTANDFLQILEVYGIKYV